MTLTSATRRRFLFLSLVLLAGVSCNRERSSEHGRTDASGAEAAASVDRVLASARHPWIRWPSIPDVTPQLKPLYASEPDRLLWFDDSRPSRTLEGVLAAIAAADDYGLEPGDYDSAALAQRWPAIKAGSAPSADRASFDLAVSIAVVRMLRAVHTGRVDPATMDWGYDIAPSQFDVAAALQKIRDGQALGAALDAVEPPFSHYARARRTLAAYRALARNGEPTPVPELPKGRSKLQPGTAWAGVPALAIRLHRLGDLTSSPDAASMAYSSALAAAVKRFQARHGLEPDGVIGAGTIAALNVPLAQRVRQLELSMERMRWLPTLSDRPNVFVNVALFRMWATDPSSADEPLRMNVVVGKSLDHKTPIFVERMEYVIFRPYWNPPHDIAVAEILPHARRDDAYMSNEDLEIVANADDDAPVLPATGSNLDAVEAGTLMIRQRPGPKNSLGLAKFIFPNDDDIYMHGSPAQQLFSRARRDFSHGCIRLEDPARFAAWVLRDQPEWTAQKIDEAMQGDRPTRVNLKQKLTVVIFYDTVHVNHENVVFFVDDIYGHDKTLDAALRRGYPYRVKG